jgi:excisionase family DNA binding protein
MDGQSAHDPAPGVSGAADTWPLSARDAAAVLGISERTVRRAIGRGDLVAAKHGGTFRIDPAEVERFGRRNPKSHSMAPARDRSVPRSVQARNLTHEIGHALSVIHHLTGHELQGALHRTPARQWELLSIVQQVCASCLAVGLNDEPGAHLKPGTEMRFNGEDVRLGVDGFLDETSRSYGSALTRREIEVLHLLAMNVSNRAIADSLFISVPTVKRHVTNILGKLGVSNRYEAVQVAQFRGLP